MANHNNYKQNKKGILLLIFTGMNKKDIVFLNKKKDNESLSVFITNRH